MRANFLSICRGLDRITAFLCVLACVVLTASVLAIVILRFGFDTGFIKLQNLCSEDDWISMGKLDAMSPAFLL